MTGLPSLHGCISQRTQDPPSTSSRGAKSLFPAQNHASEQEAVDDKSATQQRKQMRSKNLDHELEQRGAHDGIVHEVNDVLERHCPTLECQLRHLEWRCSHGGQATVQV